MWSTRATVCRGRGREPSSKTVDPPSRAYDLILAVGTLDTVNDLPLALRLIWSMRCGPAACSLARCPAANPARLRAPCARPTRCGRRGAACPSADRAGDARPLLIAAGSPTRSSMSTASACLSLAWTRWLPTFARMGATNILAERARTSSVKRARTAAAREFRCRPRGERTNETFEILHFAAWSAELMPRPLTFSAARVVNPIG